jgi:hypothetical protein
MKEIMPYFNSGFLLAMSDAAGTEIAASERQVCTEYVSTFRGGNPIGNLLVFGLRSVAAGAHSSLTSLTQDCCGDGWRGFTAEAARMVIPSVPNQRGHSRRKG